MSSKARKVVVERVREEGRAAAEAGRHRQTCPYSTYDMNRQQWLRGYDSHTEQHGFDDCQ